VRSLAQAGAAMSKITPYIAVAAAFQKMAHDINMDVQNKDFYKNVKKKSQNKRRKQSKKGGK